MVAEWARTKAQDILKGYVLLADERTTVEEAVATALEAERKRNRDIAFGHAQSDERNEAGDCGRVPYEIVKTIEMVEKPCQDCGASGKVEYSTGLGQVDCPMCGGSGGIFRKSEACEEA